MTPTVSRWGKNVRMPAYSIDSLTFSSLDRSPRPLADGETVDLGGKEVRTRRVRQDT
jgi:hypothetical protein